MSSECFHPIKSFFFFLGGGGGGGVLAFLKKIHLFFFFIGVRLPPPETIDARSEVHQSTVTQKTFQTQTQHPQIGKD